MGANTEVLWGPPRVSGMRRWLGGPPEATGFVLPILGIDDRSWHISSSCSQVITFDPVEGVLCTGLSRTGPEGSRVRTHSYVANYVMACEWINRCLVLRQGCWRALRGEAQPHQSVDDVIIGETTASYSPRVSPTDVDPKLR